MGRLGFPEIIVVLAVTAGIASVLVVPAWLILRRIGLPPLLAILTIIPGVNVLLLWYVALSPWPTDLNRRDER